VSTATTRDAFARWSPDEAPGGGVLVIDQDGETLADRHLVAHLGPDEPAVNAGIVAEL
jgi:hypothetical protein